MNNPTSLLSRRQWLERVSFPTLTAVATGAAVTVAKAGAAETTAAPGSSVSPIPASGTPAGHPTIYDIRAFGAKGDGVTLDSTALQAAIDACHGAGGGTVLVPAGDFVIGTTELKSNVTLHVSNGARLLGSSRREDFRAGEGVPRGNGNMVLLFAVNARNIAIEGPGTINGRGATFFTGHGDATSPAAVRRQDSDAAKPNVDRPHMLIFYRCENVTLHGVFLTESAYHGVRFLQSKQIRCDGVRIYNRVNFNNDGFHFSSCEYVQIANCEIRCQDDACALFGSNRYVTVTNCIFSTRWSIFRFGSGNSQNVTVSNCLIYETYGCPIKIDVGQGQVENLMFSNIVMKNVTGPISVAFSGVSRRGGSSQRPAPAGPFYVRNISFNNIQATLVTEPVQHADMPFAPNPWKGEQHSCLTLNGVGDAWLENISLTDVHITSAGGGTAPLAAKREVPQMAAEYFGVWNTEPYGPPAYGIYARNVKGLSLRNVRLEFEQKDVRPALILDHVRDAAIAGLSVEGEIASESSVRIIESQDVLFAAPRLVTPAPAFIRLEGAANEGIIVDGGDLRKAARPVDCVDGATEKMVIVRT